jgi:putative endonuclease
MASYYVYIMMNEDNSVHFVGFANNLVRRVQEHRTEKAGFYQKNGLRKLVYYEKHDHFEEAKRREDIIKSWDKEYFKNIISISNSKYEDLFYKAMKILMRGDA